MLEQSQAWSEVAAEYECEFVDPDAEGGRNPMREALARLAGSGAVLDLGCGPGVLLPTLAEQFASVTALDFAPLMLDRARERCRGRENVSFLRADLAELPHELCGRFDVAVAVNSLILPDVERLDQALQGVARALKPGGRFLGIVPAIDSVHYHTMLLIDRARRAGFTGPAALREAARHGEHHLYDFAFGTFRYRGLAQHFWQPFEVTYRLGRAGFGDVRLDRVELAWHQCAGGADLADEPPPWDWFFEATRL